ncbi:MAG: endonuclease/exonuclease/phosphatase family protein, partial [Lacipirellulaceae bacterium]
CWIVPAYVLLRYGMNRTHRAESWLSLLLWGVFFGLFVDEIPSLWRGLTSTASAERPAYDRPEAIRVVTANCSQGTIEAVTRTLEFQPSILLLQESPGKEALSEIAVEYFGDGESLLHGQDTSILAKGKITAHEVPRDVKCRMARVELTDGPTLLVVCLRLTPPPARIDFCSPEFWKAHAENRRQHRQELLDILAEVESLNSSHPVLIGGDFNLQPRDTALDSLRKNFRDAFREVGHGWGHTGTNAFPLFRVDMLWSSETLKPLSVIADYNEASDHRLVVGDFVVE